MLTGALLSIRPFDAVKQLTKDFNLPVYTEAPESDAVRQAAQERAERERFKREFDAWFWVTVRILAEYRRRLWRAKYNPDDSMFAEALHELDKVDYVMDLLEDDPGSVLIG